MGHRTHLADFLKEGSNHTSRGDIGKQTLHQEVFPVFQKVPWWTGGGGDEKEGGTVGEKR